MNNHILVCQFNEELLFKLKRQKLVVITNNIDDIAPVRLMKSFSNLSKHAAQGAAFIANGLLGGKFEPIINNLKLKEASGSILDDIYIPFDKEKLLSDFN